MKDAKKVSSDKKPVKAGAKEEKEKTAVASPKKEGEKKDEKKEEKKSGAEKKDAKGGKTGKVEKPTEEDIQELQMFGYKYDAGTAAVIQHTLPQCSGVTSIR